MPRCWGRRSPNTRWPPSPVSAKSDWIRCSRHSADKEVLTLQADPRSPERGQYGFLQDDDRGAVRGLLDTTVLIAREQDRPLGTLPDESVISVVTLAELHIGVLFGGGATSQGSTDAVAVQRLSGTSTLFQSLRTLPVTSP